MEMYEKSAPNSWEYHAVLRGAMPPLWVSEAQGARVPAQAGLDGQELAPSRCQDAL